MLQDIIKKHQHRVSSVTQPWLNHHAMAQNVAAKGTVAHNVWAFLDGTHIPLC